MTRADMIQRVMVKLEELSPYDQDTAFTADAKMGNVIKPVRSYIEATLDEAIKEAVGMLPLRLLSADIVNDGSLVATVDQNGVGRIKILKQGILRLVELKFPDWERSVVKTYDRTSDAYVLQQNRFTRGGLAKPVVIWTETLNNDIWECYSLPRRDVPYIATPEKCAYIEFTGQLETDTAAEYAILLCAIKVHDIYGNANQSKALHDELNQRLQIDGIQS